MRHVAEINLLNLHKNLGDNLISPSEFATLSLLSAPLQKQKKKLFQNQDFSSEIMQNLNNFHWKGVEDRARRSLIRWHEGLYPLVLRHDIPSALEILKIQAKGQRVVTVFLQTKEWQELHHGKTAWEFTLHDLIHADHFFEKPDWREGQIYFYNFLLKTWDHPIFQSLHADPQFEYLIADMNTHPQHLFLTLKALVLKVWKTNLGLSLEQTLPTEEESVFQKLMLEWEILIRNNLS